MPKLIKIETSSDVANFTPSAGYATLFYAVVEGKIVLKCKTSAGVVEDVSSAAEASVVTIVNDYWYIDGVTTGIKAKGVDGADGEDGADGSAGAAGPANTLSIGTVSATTGDPSATITGTAPTQTLNLTLKTGAAGTNGTNGTNGTDGAAGLSAYEVWLAEDNEGTEADFLASLVGADGEGGGGGGDESVAFFFSRI